MSKRSTTQNLAWDLKIAIGTFRRWPNRLNERLLEQAREAVREAGLDLERIEAACLDPDGDD